MTEAPQITNDQARWAILQRKVHEQQAARAFELFRSHDIEPILIKGFAAEMYYPPDLFRDSIDIDLAVSAADFERAESILKSTEADGLAIDLHRELRHLDSLTWEDLFENSILIEANQIRIRVLRPEDHLRVLAVHWLNDGGINRSKLWDIFYLIANRPSSFDWHRALEIVPARRRRWIECTILLAEKYLDLDLEGTPLKGQQESLPGWLCASVERSWADPPDEVPLWLVTGQPTEFFKQLRMRLTPNPVRATIEMQGSLDARTRLFYRAGNFVQRSLPSLGRNLRSLEK